MKILIVLALLLPSAPAVYACSCAGYPSICSSYQQADAVFTGVVQTVRDNKAKDEQGKEYWIGQAASVQVEKSFKGTPSPEVIFRTEGSSCDAVYKEGQRWLFYAHYDKQSKTWGIFPCDRSTLIDEAADDLLYLQGLPKSASTTRLSGVLEHFETDPEKGFTRVKNIIGAKVKIAGEGKTYEVYTGQDGVFEIYDLPPGKYAIDPEIPLGLKLRFPIHYGSPDYSSRRSVGMVLKEKSCASVAFVLSSKNRIAGSVFGVDGRALPNVCLNLTPKDKPARSNWIFDCTDEKGRYELSEIPPGEYLIVLNDDGKISSDEPFPTTYFPGVFEKDKATLLTITESTNLEDYDVHIPSQEARKTLTGVLQFSDGKPVAGEFVEFKSDQVKQGFDGEVHVKTDDQGRFTLTVLEGLKGAVRGFMFSYEGEFLNCPQLDKLLKTKPSDVGTKPLPMEITRDVDDIKLTFPFPHCKKAKD